MCISPDDCLPSMSSLHLQSCHYCKHATQSGVLLHVTGARACQRLLCSQVLGVPVTPGQACTAAAPGHAAGTPCESAAGCSTVQGHCAVHYTLPNGASAHHGQCLLHEHWVSLCHNVVLSAEPAVHAEIHCQTTVLCSGHVERCASAIEQRSIGPCMLL